MEIQVPFSDDLRQRLKDALPKAADPDHVAALAARAGAIEVLSQAAGVAVFSSIADQRAYRIYCLLEAGMTLEEAEAIVAAIFGVESRRAKTMVNGAVARYRVELRGKVGEAITVLLDEAEWDKDGNWVMRLPSLFVRDRVADELEALDVPDPVPARRGTLWKMSNETYQALRSAFDLPENPAPDEGA